LYGRAKLLVPALLPVLRLTGLAAIEDEKTSSAWLEGDTVVAFHSTAVAAFGFPRNWDFFFHRAFI